MMSSLNLLPIVRAAQSESIGAAALAYAALSLSIIPLDGKRPALKSWTQYQNQRADAKTIRTWTFGNVGIVCGAVSGNLVVLDLDGVAGYAAFAATFPALAQTYTVASGGGIGRHVYFYSDHLPLSVKAMNTPIGHLEICGDGRQVVAPPSIHPITGQPYRVEKALDILRVPNLDDLVAWVETFKPRQEARTWQPPKISAPSGDAPLNRRVIEEISHVLIGQGFKQHGEWLHGRCLYPERHKYGDRNPSFGFNTASGYGHCYLCGTMLAKEICARLNIDPGQLGGLVEKPQPPTIQRRREPPADPPQQEPPAPPMKLPDWLERYMAWAGATGNQTPLIFHQAAGLWLLATAVGRRLYGESPWGVRIYPNLYMMLVAGTTFYRKSTAYKLAESVARAAIPHMLMPTPGSPERFQEALAGRLPVNFDKLTKEQKDRFTKAQPFAAQRGLLKDEVSGLFGAINKRDYMIGLKDLIMELYDCPDYFDKDTQTGLNVVENAALSILGVTTPASLGSAISAGDWDNGLLVRFALLMPEPDYAERPASLIYQPAPNDLIDDLRKLHERLPTPEMTEMGWSAPGALRLNVECWAEVQRYGDHLRRLCDPRREVELDERLKGVYGRMHVQAFKLAALFAALDWLKTDGNAPTVTVEHWNAAQAICDGWRTSAHRLLDQLDKSGEAVIERRLQDRVLTVIQEAGAAGVAMRDLYRKLNLSAKQARQLAQDLIRAGLIEERRIERAEAYIAVEHVIG
ncbi:MAG: bifunctional DNA primase/polymerase [Anaerolineae bacterium]|nr:bifunctional DNA primase/polymerase [Anaerolineae bacterium]NUQ05212.1 bifunctional DNA primase/polymerase [Anaerolineae bacterium]